METPPSDSNERFKAAIERALDQPLRSVADFDAAAVLQARLDSLARFVQAGFPLDLAQMYVTASQLTKNANQIAERCLAIWKAGALVPQIGDGYMFMLAKANLDLIASDPGVTTNAAQETQNERTRQEVLDAILNSTGESTYRHVIEKAFAGRNQLDVMNAYGQATMLIAQKEQLDARYQMALAAKYLALIWRYLLYKAVLEDVGSELQDKVHREKSIKLMGELGMTLLEKLGFDLIGVAKQIYEAISLLRARSKELAAEEFASDLTKRYQLAKECVTLYRTAITTWSESATKANAALEMALAEFAVLFSRLGQTFRKSQGLAS